MNETEAQFAEMMTLEGWEVFHKGFPDFICAKGDQLRFVEVKAGYDKLQPHQQAVLSALHNGGCDVLVWHPRGKLIPGIGNTDITPPKVLPKSLKRGWPPVNPERDREVYETWCKWTDSKSLCEIGSMFTDTEGKPLSGSQVHQIVKREQAHRRAQGETIIWRAGQAKAKERAHA